MRTSAKIFWILGAFFVVAGAAYGVVTGFYEPLGVELAGFPAILAAGGLSIMIAIYLTLNARKHPRRPEDRLDGDLDEDAGVQGSFSPYSWQPLWASIGAALCFLGVAAGWWIFALGFVVAMYGVVAWVLEFSRGQYQH